MSTRMVVLTDHSISSMSGSAQALIAQDANRSYLEIFNNGADNVTLTFMAWSETSSAGGAAGGSMILVTNGRYLVNNGSIPGNAIQVTGTSGQPVTCYTSP